MKKIILTILTSCCLLNFLYSQTPEENFNKLKAYYKAHAVVAHKNPNIHLNKGERILEISGTNIPLFEVKILYNSIQNSHVVTFNCDGCIIWIDKNGKTQKDDGFGIEFKTNDECYTFINLISDLKHTLKTK